MQFTERERLIATAFLLEGEGSFMVMRTERGNFHYQVRCGMTDIEPLQKLYRWWGGGLYGPYKQAEEHWKLKYIWVLGTREEVYNLVTRIKGMLSPRRKQQVQRILDTMKSNPRKYRIVAEHGTNAMYSGRQACRCDACRTAATEARRARYASPS